MLLTQAISCEQDGSERRPYTCVSCLDFTLQGALSFDSAPCTLTLVEDDTQLFRLRTYVRVLAQEEINPDRFWIGYRHINATTIQDSGGNTVASGPVTDGGNFAADSPGPAADMCLAIRSDGDFTRVPCSDELPFICHEVFAGEWVTALFNKIPHGVIIRDVGGNYNYVHVHEHARFV